jgi:hypothetical protein
MLYFKLLGCWHIIFVNLRNNMIGKFVKAAAIVVCMAFGVVAQARPETITVQDNDEETYRAEVAETTRYPKKLKRQRVYRTYVDEEDNYCSTPSLVNGVGTVVKVASQAGLALLGLGALYIAGGCLFGYPVWVPLFA